MTEPQAESYTLDVEELLEIFLDGMLSGVTSSLINVKYGPDDIEGARHEAMYQLMAMVNDPAMTETVRDTIRARLRGEPNTRTVLKVKSIHQED